MHVLVKVSSDNPNAPLLVNVREALPEAKVTLAIGNSASGESAWQGDAPAVDSIIAAPPELDEGFCSKFNLIVPGECPDDWTEIGFLEEYAEAAKQDKLWMLPTNPCKTCAGAGARHPDPAGAPISRLTVVTSSFNYGDYFAVSAHLNRPLVDRLIVATSVDDHETIRSARREGCEAMIVATETPTRPPFAVVGHKNYFINRALRTVPAGEWVLHLDSDIVLPPFFPNFLEDGSFVPGHLYGSKARRLCDNELDVLASYPDGPWLDRLEICEGIIGYFGLFQRSNDEHPLPEDRPDRTDVLLQDDHIFLMSFPEKVRDLTDLQVMHLGSTGVNWGQRTSNEFQREMLLRISQQEILEQDEDDLRTLLKSIRNRGEHIAVLRMPTSRHLSRAALEELGPQIEISAIKTGSRAIALWWEEADLRDFLRWFRDIPAELDELVLIGKGLDHLYHPKMATAVRFLFGTPDENLGEGWSKTLTADDLQRVRQLSRLIEHPNLQNDTEPLLVLALPEDSSTLNAILWLESVAVEAKLPVAIFSGDRAADIEVRALELGFHVITGEYVKLMSRPSLEKRTKEALANIGATNSLVIEGIPDGRFNSAKVAEWFSNGFDRRELYAAEDFSLPQKTDIDLTSLVAIFHRLRMVAEHETQVHIVTSPGPELDEFLLRLSTWPLPPRAIVYLCEVADQQGVNRRSRSLDFRVRVRRSRPESVLVELVRSHPTDEILELPSDLICRRTAFIPLKCRVVRDHAARDANELRPVSPDLNRTRLRKFRPDTRDLERWGWIKHT